MGRPGILALGHFDKAAVAVVLHAVADKQKGLGRVAEQRQDQRAQLEEQERTAAQTPVCLVVAHLRQVVGQMRARIVVGRAEQIRDVSRLRHHRARFLLKLPPRA